MAQDQRAARLRWRRPPGAGSGHAARLESSASLSASAMRIAIPDVMGEPAQDVGHQRRVRALFR